MNRDNLFVWITIGLFGGVIAFGFVTMDDAQAFSGDLKTFSSHDELNAFIAQGAAASKGWSGGLLGQTMFEARNSAALAEDSSSQATSSDGYSETNVQVAGVDEADIIKTDGTYIYLAISNNDGTSSIIIVEAAREATAADRLLNLDPFMEYTAMERVADIAVEGHISGLFLTDNRLVAIVGSSDVFIAVGIMEDRVSIAPGEWYPYTSGTTAIVYDITDPAAPSELARYSAEGSYVSARMVGDWVYIVINSYVTSSEGNVTLPVILKDEERCIIEPADINYIDVPSPSYSYLIIASINVVDGESTQETFLFDSSSIMYMSPENMYLVSTNYWVRYLGAVDGGTNTETTDVYAFSVDDGDVTYRATGSVPGHVLNQFSMDEYNGHLRIATTTSGGWWESAPEKINNVYILDDAMDVVGAVEGLAPGEDIYSVRFMGDRGYIVTFKTVDPLFVLDLATPTNPSVLGELKIPGYSDYLHPYDETHLIGIGKDAVAAEEGDWAWYQGLKLALFDVSDPENPIELTKVVIGDRGTSSEALYDHHAFLFSAEKDLLVIPAQVYEIAEKTGDPGRSYGTPVYEGAFVFELTLENGFEKMGTITHQPDTAADKDWWPEWDHMIKRSLYIGDVLYTMSNSMLKANDLGTALEEIDSVRLD